MEQSKEKTEFKLLKGYNETIWGELWGERQLYQVELTKDHPIHGKAGTKGGHVEKESNIRGSGWVAKNAKALGNTIVKDSIITDNAIVRDSVVQDGAIVRGNAKVRKANLLGCIVEGNAEVYPGVEIHHDIIVNGDAQVSGRIILFNDTPDSTIVLGGGLSISTYEDNDNDNDNDDDVMFNV